MNASNAVFHQRCADRSLIIKKILMMKLRILDDDRVNYNVL